MAMSDKVSRDLYIKLGFVDLIPPLDDNLTTITMCRNFQQILNHSLIHFTLDTTNKTGKKFSLFREASPHGGNYGASRFGLDRTKLSRSKPAAVDAWWRNLGFEV